MSYGMLGAVIFGSYEGTKRLISHGRQERHTDAFLAGAVAGVLSSIPTAPVELLKCRAQVHLTPDQAAVELNPITCAGNIVRHRGLRGMFAGLAATMGRDVPALAMYFWSYELLCLKFGVRESMPGWLMCICTLCHALTTDPSADEMTFEAFAKLNLAGGLAGMLMWCSYPMDVVKTRMQTQSLTHPAYKSTWHCMQVTVKREGARALFRGFGATVFQAFPVSAVTFGVYELVLLAFKRHSESGPVKAHG